MPHKQALKRFLTVLNNLALQTSNNKKNFSLSEENEVQIDLFVRYFNNDPSFEEEGRSLSKGILIQGNYGSGKTMMFNAARLLKQVFPRCNFGFQTCPSMNERYLVGVANNNKNPYSELAYWSKKACIHKPNGNRENRHMVLDDLGAEDVLTVYGNKVSVMAYILSERFNHWERNGLITHMTTNLNGAQRKEYYGGRIDSRMYSMFNLITLGGNVDSTDHRKN